MTAPNLNMEDNSDKLKDNTDKNIQHKQGKNKAPAFYSIAYDALMLLIISIDLVFIFVDNVLMSDALHNFGHWLMAKMNFSLLADMVTIYANQGYGYFSHAYLSMAGGAFTIFLITELLMRWGLAIINKTHYRWFFFPFVHWYEVLGCFPQLRVLRLLRAVVIGKRLYQMGYQILPKSWIKSIQFYYGVVLEELSDRVLLTAIANIRTQLNNSVDSQALVKKTIDSNRDNIEQMILSMLRTELAPRLRDELMPNHQASPVAKHVGLAIREAVEKTPEINFVLGKIPIAGRIIESQIMGISEKVGYNIADSVSNRLLNDEVLDEVFVSIAHGISQIDPSNPALEALVANIIEEALTAFEQQVKVQQWQHQVEIDNIHL